MHNCGLLAGAAMLFAAVVAAPAIADDWIATKLRGGVFAFENGGWVQLKRGDVVPDGMVVRTKPGGRVTLSRGKESVAIGPDTQTQILDHDGDLFTTVKQWYGTVEVDAEARNVQHFQVVNPLLAAVVKGTKFVVRAGANSSEVEVKRGHVEVHDNGTAESLTVDAGQSVSVAANGTAPMAVEDTEYVPPEAPENIGNTPGASTEGDAPPEVPAELIADWEAEADAGTPPTTPTTTEQTYQSHPYYTYWYHVFHSHHGHHGHGGGDD